VEFLPESEDPPILPMRLNKKLHTSQRSSCLYYPQPPHAAQKESPQNPGQPGKHPAAHWFANFSLVGRTAQLPNATQDEAPHITAKPLSLFSPATALRILSKPQSAATYYFFLSSKNRGDRDNMKQQSLFSSFTANMFIYTINRIVSKSVRCAFLGRMGRLGGSSGPEIHASPPAWGGWVGLPVQ